MFRLDPHVALSVQYLDNTAFGSPITDRPSESVRQIFAPVLEHTRRHGRESLISAGPGLLRNVTAGRAFEQIARRTGRSWQLRDEFLYPDPAAVSPHLLTFYHRRSGEQLRLRVDDSAWPELHSLTAHLAGAGVQPDDFEPSARARTLFDALRRAGLLVENSGNGGADSTGTDVEPDLTFVGHNTVVVRSGATKLVIDPFLFSRSPAFPSSYQPYALSEFGQVDVVLITHSHPDHFDPASLLRFPTDVRIVIPNTGPETILCTDMARRLRELGFTDIVTMDWWTSQRFGSATVHALPFYGEQPTDGPTLHPEVRNAGNTYLIETESFSAAFVSDCGRDGSGDIRTVASDWHLANGPVDLVFSGYRSWTTYPAQLLFSSVSGYLPFVPPELWGMRSRLMNDPDDAIDVAERWGARYLFPYGDGGAPWYWSIGLGPCLDGRSSADAEDVDFDPFPERVVDAATRRVRFAGSITGRSAVRVGVLRPGDALRGLPAAPELIRAAGHAWPFGTRQVSSPDIATDPDAAGRSSS
ncbi:MBL fold metallo-hydrolase [Nocardia sp. NPDC046473]|uniref:MBL fold metallo-hydrolase n=1 Tax=Nocardia sp. NPDC046473 TaxID=3155733 RepID=UPI0033FDA964